MSQIEKTVNNLLNLLGIPSSARVAVACSGGADSMALALLAHAWALKNNTSVVAITVDHGLRKESAKEAAQVSAWLKKHGIKQVMLKWSGKKPTRNIQEAARNARYRLLTDYCKEHDIAHLLVAHHLEDQAETFLLRLARGSGVDGLSAMSSVGTMYGVTLVRPLLTTPKKELLAYLKKLKQPFIDDPSNENDVYDRVKMRKLLPQLARVGLTPERLSKTAANMARARGHLETQTQNFLRSTAQFFPEGYAVIAHWNADDEIVLRALSVLIKRLGGGDEKSRLSDLERLQQALKIFSFTGATLGGCVFAPLKKSTLIYREQKNIAAPLPIKRGETLVWDNRFEITLTHAPQRLKLGALTQDGWLWCAKHYGLTSSVPDKKILYTLPALRDAKGSILCVPHLKITDETVIATINPLFLS